MLEHGKVIALHEKVVQSVLAPCKRLLERLTDTLACHAEERGNIHRGEHGTLLVVLHNEHIGRAAAPQFLLHRIERLDVLDLPFKGFLAREPHHEERKAVAVHEVFLVRLTRSCCVGRFTEHRGHSRIFGFDVFNSVQNVLVLLVEVFRDLAALDNNLTIVDFYQFIHYAILLCNHTEI